MKYTPNLAEDVASLFRRQFHNLTEKAPLSWQERLFRNHFINNDLPSAIDLPTGLGKTMVMAIWLIARSINENLPRRLIYVVDRRTVVDQATDLALLLKSKVPEVLPNIGNLAISTLRGQLADNREWTRDPSRPAIIIGTVDLIGSGLLFSGYRSSFKRRPLEAGLLGQDSLLVLDEAHLSKPFENLVTLIANYQKAHGNPMRVIRMSATSSGGVNKNQFTLDDADLTKLLPDYDGRLVPNPVVVRFEARKNLRIIRLDEKGKLTDALAKGAINLAQNNSFRGKRIVVFVRKPDDAKAVAKAIREHVIEAIDQSGPKPKKIKNTPYVDSVEVLTGTMRGLERDELLDIDKPVMKRFLNGDEDPDLKDNKKPVFLVATSAGEVGFDLNADHMVCDATTIDSLVQRLGRVNRRGMGDAQIHLFLEPSKKEKEGKTKKFEGLELAIANTIGLLQGITDVSPKNIADLKHTAWSTIPDEEQGKDNPKSPYDLACSPVPMVVELTDILLDAWSMTSITAPMPGRPEVGPWLRGIDDELPQTTIAWRAELDESGFADLDLDDIEEWFDRHRVLTHETLSVPTHLAARWFIDRWASLPEPLRSQIGNRPVIADRGGITRMTLKRLIDQLSRKGADGTATIRYADIILPASFGGVERGIGLLDAKAPPVPKDESKLSMEERRQAARVRLLAPDVADLRERYREIFIKSEDGESEVRTLGTGVKPSNLGKHSRYVLTLESEDDKRVQVVSYLPKREKPEWGTRKQTLVEHVGLVLQRINELLDRLDLPDTIKMAARLAASWHDHGKNRERWQRCAGRKDGEPPLGKSGGAMKRDPRRYRHEFGSLREFADAFNAGKVADDAGEAISGDVFDLAMHLIATHHGRGRPHFPKGAFDPDCEKQSDQIHTEAIRRFACLQRKYGWWRLAWLENLLRCADALASADDVSEDDVGDANEEGGRDS